LTKTGDLPTENRRSVGAMPILQQLTLRLTLRDRAVFHRGRPATPTFFIQLRPVPHMPQVCRVW
jgi:hypothetical protein